MCLFAILIPFSVQFSLSVVSQLLWPHGLQYARLPCPSPTPGSCSNSWPSSWWCHPTISSSVIPFSSCLQSFPASGSFQMRQFFASGGQSIGVSALASVLAMNIQDWFPTGWIGWISLQSKGLMSNSLRPHGLQHARPPCPSPSPGACSKSCSSCQWCHPTISSSVIPFSFCLQSFPASGSFPMSQFCTSGGQSIGASVSASVLPMNIEDWFPLRLTGWISLQSKGLSMSSPTPQFKSINSSVLSFLYSPTLTFIHDYWKS